MSPPLRYPHPPAGAAPSQEPAPAPRLLSPRPVVWLTDWSDQEDAEFRAAWHQAGLAVRVVRGAPLGTTVGTPYHRLRAYPVYLSLALRGLLARDRPVVAWQAAAGAVAGLLRQGARPPLTVLNPVLTKEGRAYRQRVALAGLRRSDLIVFYSRRSRDHAVQLGLDPSRATFIPLGVSRKVDHPAPPGPYLLAGGREHRDWETLLEAARGLPLPVWVAGPRTLVRLGHLRTFPRLDKAGYRRLVAGAAALVVPLRDGQRQAGQLALLEAFSYGKPVIATSGPGTVDYLTADRGILVPPQDPAALHHAMRNLCDPGVAAQRGAAALAAANGPLSLARFVREVDAAACGLVT